MLSIVIITCNRIDSLMKTIESCLNKTAREWELIIVDNGSSDGTPETVKKYCKEKGINLKFLSILRKPGSSWSQKYRI